LINTLIKAIHGNSGFLRRNDALPANWGPAGMKFTRRDFLGTAVASSAAPLIALNSTDAIATTSDEPHDHAAHIHPKPVRPSVPRLPALICRMAGTTAIDEAYQTLAEGRDTLDSALHVTQAQEDDPDDQSTGRGGLPTEQGEVQLDASCIHGPTRRGAAIACVSGIRNASLLARTAMEHSDYPLLVGQGAQRLALAHGFSKEELLTDRSRKMWTAWQHIMATASRGPGLTDPNWPFPGKDSHFLPPSQQDLNTLVRSTERLAVDAGLGPQWTWRAAYDALFPTAEPLYVGTVNEKKEMSAVATTSGLPWRPSGIASDIAVIGSGIFLDPEIGSAGASGNAPANMKIAGARKIIDNMRSGMSPEDAGMDVLRQMARWYQNDTIALRFVEIVYYILRKDGAYGSVSLWQGDKTGHTRQFTIHDGVRRSENCRFLLAGSPANGGDAILGHT
jgi:N4-(beta-N-acetylglucosaminyl)-L-asparaginase